MSDRTEHMELPYRAGNGLRIEYGPIIAGDGFFVATVNDGQSDAKAKRDFIIRACNSHADLLEACELVTEHFNRTDARYDCTGRRVVFTGVAEVVLAAIAKARGE